MDDLTLVIPCKGQDCDGAQRWTNLPPHTIIVKNKCYGEAILKGIQSATTTYVGTMDADGQHTLRDIGRLYTRIRATDGDLVIGQRPHPDGGVRSIASGMLNLTASILTGRHVPDLGCGARVF